MRTWLVVAAEALEFSGILKRCGPVRPLDGAGAEFASGVQFAREAHWKGDRWWWIANGPGASLVRQALGGEALKDKRSVDGIISTGFCGALDPSLAVGTIVIDGQAPVRSGSPFVRGRVCSTDRVVITAEEKRALRTSRAVQGVTAPVAPIAVDMEFAEVRSIAGEWGVPVRAIRVVSDTAADNLPLDFNRYRDAQGRFSRARIALGALGRPWQAVPGLLRLNRNCSLAADKLGEFFADSEF